MNHLKLAQFVLLFLFVGPSVFAKSPEAQLSGLKNWRAHTSIYIAENSGKVLFENQSESALVPASVTKLVTAATVLKHFPAGTRLKTQIYGSGQREDRVWKGDLYLKGGGDPGFVSETMWFLVNHFLRSGIQKIEGRIRVDDSLFLPIRVDPSRESVRVDRAYDAPIGAMSFNWNSVNIFVRPADQIGESARVFADPMSGYIDLKAKVKTVAKGQESNINVDREASKTGDVVRVTGQIALGAKEVTVYKNITKPDLWAGAQLRAFLLQRGVMVTGEVEAAKTPMDAELLAEAESKPIEQMLADMNKFSNNYVAEMLTNNLAAQNDPPGSIEKGMLVVEKYIRSLGISDRQAKLVNPSGLTRLNRLSAKALWTVMHDMSSHLITAPEFLSSLSIGGVDGTLKKRFKDDQHRGWIRGKTGYIDDVVSLAGFAGRPDGRVVPFVLIYNGKEDEGKVRQIFDDVVRNVLL